LWEETTVSKSSRRKVTEKELAKIGVADRSGDSEQGIKDLQEEKDI
jgi:hypothetical protein